MKALIYNGPETLAYGDAPDPAPAPGEALIRVDSAGVCGSDMHAYLGHDDRRPAPLILGHEVAGRIVDGPGAGSRVTVNPLVTCGACPACASGRDNLCGARQIISMPPRAGGFATLLAMPTANLVPVPDHVSDDQAALAEPLACGWHGVRLGRETLGRPEAAIRALVIGGGPIGLGAALSLAAQGASDVTMVEPNALRRDFLATRCGQRVAAPDGLPDGARYDLVVDGVGVAATRAQASACAAPGGVIVHIGLGSGEGGLDVRRMTLQEIAFLGVYTYTAADFRAAAAALFDGRLGPLDWTEPRPLADGARAFADLRAAAVAAPKIILKPH